MTTALEGLMGQRHAPAALYPRERPGTHCTGGWLLHRNSKENGSGSVWVLKVSIHWYSFIVVYFRFVIWDLSSQLCWISLGQSNY